MIDTWTQRDGTKIKIVDMADSHIKNTAKFLERGIDKIRTFPLPCFDDEGEAQYWAEQEFDREQERLFSMLETQFALQAEIKRRKK